MEPFNGVFRAVASGIRAQWIRRAPQWPPLFEALAASPRCLTGLLRMRAAATTDEARAIYEDFEERLSALFDQPRVDWPANFGAFASRPPTARESVRDLPRVAPEQALMLLGPLHHLEGASANLYASALQTCFGQDSTWPVADEVMLRLLTPHIPATWNHQWSRGFGLEPPSVWGPPVEADLERVLEGLARGRSVEPGLLGRRGVVEIALTHTTIVVGASIEDAARDAPLQAA
ncbi:MAG: hypothetical protein ACE37F_34585 [Nannocystaceae bacterium]|nr:hypothetical protein [bacterium]